MMNKLMQTARPLMNIFRRYSQEAYSGLPEKCMNKVQLLGRVGMDPITRGNERKVVYFSLATTSGYLKKGTEEYVRKTQWHDINVFLPNLMERSQTQIKKGSRVLVTGDIEYDNYTRKDGSQVKGTTIVADDIYVLSGLKNV